MVWLCVALMVIAAPSAIFRKVVNVESVSTLWVANVMTARVRVASVESSVLWMVPPLSVRLLASTDTPSLSRSPVRTV